ncbi:MAG: sigma factor-like helix-turn-helix DNA-binding protein [Planctomycetota bacterium]
MPGWRPCARRLGRRGISGPGSVAWCETLRSSARGAARRGQREEAAAAPRGSPPTPEELAESLETQRRLAALVLGLAEPIRHTVLLRYYEGLPPAEIARRTGAPAGTVRWRLKRGLDFLRERLDEEHGARRTWCALLAPLAGARNDGASLATATIGGTLAMNTKLVILAAAGTALLLGVWVMWPAGSAVEPPAGPGRAGAAALATPHDDAVSPEKEPRVSRAVVPAVSPGEPYGALAVHAVWATNGAPATEVAIVFRSLDEPVQIASEVQVVTDDAGVARAPRQHAGAVEIESDRGGRLETTAEPGGDHDIAFVIPPGIAVEGVVVDEAGRPVAGAGIWLTAGRGDWLGGRIVARAGEEGTFQVPSVDPGQSLGACADGDAPSELVDLERLDGPATPVRLRLVLTLPGATIEGFVVRDDGEPIAGALVAIGHRGGFSWRADGTHEESWTPCVIRSGRDGPFRRESVAPGDPPISVRAGGFPLWCEERSCRAGETTFVEVVLERGATVRGTVRGEDDVPASGARVIALDRPFERNPWLIGPLDPPNAFGRATALSGQDGECSLALVPAGEIHLFAVAGTSFGEVTGFGGTDATSVSAAPGDVIRWDAKLSRGLVIRGRVQSESGGPPNALAPIHATPERNGASARATLLDDEGRFLFAECEAVPYTISYSVPGAAASESGVWPGSGEVVLTLPEGDPGRPAVVTGRVVDSGARAAENAELSVRLASPAG